jgi:CDP-paratose 2-epimerase
LAKALLSSCSEIEIVGIDNLSRKGSELNLPQLHDLKIQLIRGDIRCSSDLHNLPPVDWIIDCAANPSVLAGVDGNTSSRQLMEHNLLGTINLLEYCRSCQAGLILLSTSRVYSATELAQLPVNTSDSSFSLKEGFSTTGISSKGITEDFSTSPPISLYGASKLASETLVLEYAEAFGFPVRINRCGVLAGAGQFGKADQGIISFWIHSFAEKKPLKFIGFEGSGLQVRDALHPKDLAPLLLRQMKEPYREVPKIINLGGGLDSSISLKQLTSWCEKRFGPNEVLGSTEERPMDAPWIVMDSSEAKKAWDWTPQTTLSEILEEIARHAESNPKWLEFTN